MDRCPECNEVIRDDDHSYVDEDTDITYHIECFSDKLWIAWRKERGEDETNIRSATCDKIRFGIRPT